MPAVLKPILASIVLLLLTIPVARAADDVVALETWSMMIGLVGGLALFLYGMDHLAGALKTLAGARLRRVLSGMTRNRLWAAVSGAGRLRSASANPARSAKAVMSQGHLPAGCER